LCALFSIDAKAVDLADGKAFSYQNNLLHYDNGVTGNNHAGSFLSPGQWNTDDMTFNYKYSKDGTFFESELDLRIADDPRVETSTTSIKKIFTKFGDKTNDSIVGDYMASLSPYTLGTSLKGARYTHHFSDTLESTVLTGSPRAAWSPIWGGATAATIDRQFYGTRVDDKWGDTAMAGLNFVASDDSRVPTAAASTLTKQWVAASDWALPVIRGVALSGESAYSWTTYNNPAVPNQYIQDGWAHVVKSDYGILGYKSHIEFERVSPFFATNGGSSTPDQIRWNFNNEYKFRGPWKANFNYSWFHNNLKGVDGTAVTTTRMPQAGVRYDGPDWRPSFSIETKGSSREVSTSNTGLKSITRDGTVSVADKFYTVDTGLDYEHQNVFKTDHTQREQHDTVGMTFGTSRDLPLGVKVTPNFHWSYQIDQDLLAATTDVTRGFTASLAFKFPHAVDSNLGYSDTAVRNESGPSSDKRTYTATAGYNIHNNDKTRIELHYKRNENTFSDSNKDYQENVGEINLVFSL
jgi:hypothetical protein